VGFPLFPEESCCKVNYQISNTLTAYYTKSSLLGLATAHHQKHKKIREGNDVKIMREMACSILQESRQ